MAAWDVRTGISALFLALQIGGILYARTTPSRHFCWAPYDAITLYELHVTVGGRQLSPEETLQRYRLLSFRDNRSIQHVIDIVRQYERTYGRAEGAAVQLRYQTNGRAWQEWHWPAG